MLITPAFANATQTSTSLISQFAPLIIIFAIFYFLLIRPQKQRQKAHVAKLAAIVKGDVVITSGGIKGKVIKTTETELTIEIAKDVSVVVIRSTILNVEAK